MKNELILLPARLAVELAQLAPTLTTYEARHQAIDGPGGVRGRYNSRANELWRALRASDALYARINNDLANQCDAFVAALLPPADSGRYVGIPRN